MPRSVPLSAVFLALLMLTACTAEQPEPPAGAIVHEESVGPPATDDLTAEDAAETAPSNEFDDLYLPDTGPDREEEGGEDEPPAGGG